MHKERAQSYLETPIRRTTRYLKPFILLAVVSVAYWVGIARASAEELPSQSDTSHLTLGTELDALPFITGGYYFSLIGGYEHFRLRAVLSFVYPPGFAYDSERFAHFRLQADAAIIDYFFKPDLSGFWVGAGIERWIASIDSANVNSSGNFMEWVATIGVGYVWYFYENFYINPWIAGHLRVAGDSQSTVGTQIYSVNTIQGEGSVKIGWHF